MIGLLLVFRFIQIEAQQPEPNCNILACHPQNKSGLCYDGEGKYREEEICRIADNGLVYCCEWTHSVPRPPEPTDRPAHRTVQGCLPSWTSYNGHCYKHFNEPSDRVTFDEAQERCADFGGRLTDVRDRAELKFIGNLTRTPGKFAWADIPLVGLYKTGLDNPLNVFDGSKAYVSWCKDPAEPNNLEGREHCIIVLADAAYVPGYDINWPPRRIPCMLDVQCDGKIHSHGFSRYVCKADQR